MTENDSSSSSSTEVSLSEEELEYKNFLTANKISTKEIEALDKCGCTRLDHLTIISGTILQNQGGLLYCEAHDLTRKLKGKVAEFAGSSSSIEISMIDPIGKVDDLSDSNLYGGRSIDLPIIMSQR